MKKAQDMCDWSLNWKDRNAVSKEIIIENFPKLLSNIKKMMQSQR